MLHRFTHASSIHGMSHMLRFILVPGLVLISLAGQVHAQTAYSWANAASGNWNIGGNWNPAAIPGAADSALINATGPNYTVTLSDARSINNLTIDSANATVSQTGALTLGGTLNLTSGTYRVASLGSPGTSGINGGQIVSTVGTRLTGDGVLNNVALGNATNPDVLAIDNFSRNWWFYGSTDFQPGFVPTVGTNGHLLFGSLTTGTNKMLNTGFNLNGGILQSANIGSAVTLKSGNVITATGSNNVIRGAGVWNINGTVKTNDSGSTNLDLFGDFGTPAKFTIGATGSLVAGTSSGNALIQVLPNQGNSIRVDGTLRANSGGTIIIYAGNQGSQVYSSSSQLIADGGTIDLRQANFNIDGTLTMLNGGIIRMASGTTNFTNTGFIRVGFKTSRPKLAP